MRFKRVVMIMLCSTLAGCGTSRPFELWQENLDSYVAANGNGDIMCLRNTDVEASRPIFGAQKGNTLAQGVLVGCENAGAELWWIYVVGACKDDAISEVKLLAVTEHDEELVFASSAEDVQATKRYLDHRIEQWKQYRTDQPTDRDFVGLFPGPMDVFTFAMAGDVASVTEENSGATWSVVLSNVTQTRAH